MTENVSLDPGPVLLFGGPYSNLAATRAIRRTANDLGLAAGNCICTGDVVAYCAHPDAVVEAIRDWGIHVVMGNCEESLGYDAGDCGCGFEAGSACSTLSDGWYDFANQRVDRSNREWMKSLPRQLSFRLADRSFRVVHGSVSQINRFVFRSTTTEEKRAELDCITEDVVIGGHSGIPFGERIGNRAWLNAGAIGLPANDGTADGWYLLLIPGKKEVTAEWHRLRYDASSEATAMHDAGMAPEYATALQSGLWPSMDVLPPEERSQQGKRLQLPPLRIEVAR